MSKHHSNFKRLKLLSNIIYIGIAIALFTLSVIEYATRYVKRSDYVVVGKPNGYFYIVKRLYQNEILFDANCTSRYSKSQADLIFQWFISSKTDENIIFHVFYWFMMAVSFMLALFPSYRYILKYFTMDHYKITERYWLEKAINFLRAIFSVTIFVLPSFYMNTFDFDNTPCLNAYPPELSIDIIPFIFFTFIGIIIYTVFNFTVNFFYEKRRFCCSIECLSYIGLCILVLLIVAIAVFSTVIIAYVFIVSFIEEPLRLTSILIVVQFPFLVSEILSD